MSAAHEPDYESAGGAEDASVPVPALPRRTRIRPADRLILTHFEHGYIN